VLGICQKLYFSIFENQPLCLDPSTWMPKLNKTG